MAVRIEDAKVLEPRPGLKRYLLVAGNNVAISIVEIDAKKSGPPSGRALRHDFEEIIYVLEGEMEIIYPELKKKWLMKTGAAKYHPIGTAHAGKFLTEKLLILEVTSPPAHNCVTCEKCLVI